MSDIQALIRSESAMREIAAALPKHMTVERFSRAVLTAKNKNPALANVSQSSFLSAMMDCAELGLEPNDREAHLIPYGSQVKLIVGYRGLVKLAFQSGQIATIRADVVYTGDQFDYHTCEHVPHGWRADAFAPEDRGELLGAYTVIERKDKSVHRERMTAAELIKVRDATNAKKSSPWYTHFDEMAKKTVFRRACKWIQLSPHVERALDLDQDLLEIPSKAKSVYSEPSELLTKSRSKVQEQPLEETVDTVEPESEFKEN